MPTREEIQYVANQSVGADPLEELSSSLSALGISATDDDVSFMERCKFLAVEYTTHKTYEGLMPTPIPDYLPKDEQRRLRKENNAEYDRNFAEMKEYIQENYDRVDEDQPAQLLFLFIEAVIWHICVIIVARWILRLYEGRPELAQQMCIPE